MAFRLILASTSPYRRALLERFKVPFECIAPEVDESTYSGEAHEALAQRLALEKCQRVSERYPDAWVIGSDQVASSNGRLFGKPGNHQTALEQLRALSGQTLHLLTAMCVWNPVERKMYSVLDRTQLHYASLEDAVLESYLLAEKPYDCAASSKIETLGIALLEGMQTEDPTAVIGLPLIALSKLFRAAGVELLKQAILV
jgi:septum formation protein